MKKPPSPESTPPGSGKNKIWTRKNVAKFTPKPRGCSGRFELRSSPSQKRPSLRPCHHVSPVWCAKLMFFVLSTSACDQGLGHIPCHLSGSSRSWGQACLWHTFCAQQPTWTGSSWDCSQGLPKRTSGRPNWKPARPVESTASTVEVEANWNHQQKPRGQHIKNQSLKRQDYWRHGGIKNKWLTMTCLPSFQDAFQSCQPGLLKIDVVFLTTSDQFLEVTTLAPALSGRKEAPLTKLVTTKVEEPDVSWNLVQKLMPA